MLHFASLIILLKSKVSSLLSGMDKVNKNHCLFCNASFPRKDHLKTHEDSIHRNIKYYCQDCGKQYTRKDHLTSHVNNVHKGIRYKCNQCDKEFTESGTRNKHIK